MFKALLKKQFTELLQFYFRGKKSGKKRSKAVTVVLTVLLAYAFLCLGAAFFFAANTVAKVWVGTPFTWLYFALMGMLATVLGVFGSVFITSAELYRANDYEQLLALPIPPMYLLLSRMATVYGQSLFYEALVMIPTLIAYWMYAPVTVLSVVRGVVLVLLLGLFVTVLTCLFGWLVAWISSKLKNKTVFTVLFSLLFIVVYYVVYFRISSFLGVLLANAGKVGAVVKAALYPLYLFGCAGDGNWLAFIAFVLLMGALFAATLWVLSKTFLRIALSPTAVSREKYRESAVKAASPDAALLRKEVKRLTGSAVYMMNSCLGALLMPLAGVAALIFRSRLTTMMMQFTLSSLCAPMLVLAASILIGSVTLTAPSISLEGKSLWVLQSLPVTAQDVLRAKEKLHIYVLTLPIAVFALCACIALGVETTETALTVAASAVYVSFIGAFGLVLNLRHPNVTWTNETYPVKQALPVAVSMFFGWGLALIVGAVGIFLTDYVPPYTLLTVILVGLILATRLVRRWLYTKGAAVFAAL